MNSGTMNFYEYVSNDPLNYIDPTGHTECDIRIAIAIAIVKQKYNWLNISDIRIEIDNELGSSAGRFDHKKKQIVLSKRYLENLTAKQAWDLLDTLFHETLHKKYEWMDFASIAAPGQGKDDLYHKIIYDQATYDTVDYIKQFINMRKENCCGKK